jgi:hemerythrin-like domain-containing protein
MDNPIDLRVYALVHHAMRQDSQRLVDFVSGTPRDDASLATVARWYDGYLAVIHHHHTGEDEGVFPDLARRSAKLEDGLGQLEDQHVVLDALLTAMKSGLADLRQTGSQRTRSDLTHVAKQLRHHLGEHLDAEEALIFPEISRLYSPAEWQAIDEEYFKKGVSFRFMSFIAPWVMAAAAEEHRSELLAEGGPALRTLYRLSWRGRYAKLAAPLYAAEESSARLLVG